MLINIDDPSCIDVEDMDTSINYFSGLLSDDPFNLGVGCTLPPETDLLQHLSSKLEIPVVLDDDMHEDSKPTDEDSSFSTDQVLLEPLLNLLDTEGAHWSIDSFPNLSAYQNDSPCEVKTEIKLEEPSSPGSGLPPSPSSSSSSSVNGGNSLEAWRLDQPLEPKVQLETPPISPPLGSDHSPPNSPQSPTLTSLNISFVNNTTNATAAQEVSTLPQGTLKVIPCARTINGKSAQRIQPRPDNATQLSSTTTTSATWSATTTNPSTISTNATLRTGEKRKSIVLTAKEFAALAYGVRSTIAPGRVGTPVTSTSATTPVTQTTIRVQSVNTPNLTAQSLPAKVPLIPCQPLATSVPLTASFPIAVTSGTVMTTSATPTSTLVSPIKCPSVPVKRELEMKAIKRQQRMIKNRESACLSRKKKKEYVTALEGEISKLQQENLQLKLENEALRHQVKEMETSSLLAHTPISRSMMSRSKKTATALCAVFILFTLNFGAFNGLIGNRMDTFVGDLSSPQVEHHGRSLLWAPNVETTNETNAEPSDPVNGDPDAVFPANRLHPICPLHINRTESIRLDSELRRWIGVDVEAQQNVTQRHSVEQENLLDWSEVPKWQTKKESQNATVAQNLPSQTNATAANFDNRTERRRKSQRRSREMNYASPTNEVELYEKMRPPLYEYAAFLDSFQRRQDTFYVVSFSGDHIILPARALNSSVRPKMSLVLPAMPFNATAPPHRPMTMMQIDCEVINTQLLQVKEADIPPHVRSHPAKEQENTRAPEGSPKDIPKKKKAAKVSTFANETAPHSYQNASSNATSKMERVKVNLFGNITESAVVTASLTKANITGPTSSQSYRPYFVNSDYPEKFPPSKLNAAFLRSSYGSQNNEYPSPGKRVARFP